METDATTSTTARGVRALRRPSYAPPNALEPLIVVEESIDVDEEGEAAWTEGAPPNMTTERWDTPSPPPDDTNPYLLSPWRDTRKSSLPTPQCMSGITASQVRRLSERGPESGPSPREQEFLATLSAMPGPQPGGRRHSVVISRVPPPSLIMFGRGRRESIAAFSAAASRPQALASSTHNLQLDLMDDLLEFKAAKKQVSVRRCSEATGLAKSTLPLVNRRKSELPPRITKEFMAEVQEITKEATAQATTQDAGIVCSNTDLIHILTSPDVPGGSTAPTTITTTTTTTTPGQQGSAKVTPKTSPKTTPKDTPKDTPRDTPRGSLASLRANSVEAKDVHTVVVHVHGDKTTTCLAAPPAIRPAPDGVDFVAPGPSTAVSMERRDSEKVLWDERSGSIVDAGLLGSAIEGFLNKEAFVKSKRGATNSVHRATAQLSAWVTAVAIWSPKGSPVHQPTSGQDTQGGQDAQGSQGTAKAAPTAPSGEAPDANPRRRSKMTCEAVCSTLKSLFVK